MSRMLGQELFGALAAQGGDRDELGLGPQLAQGPHDRQQGGLVLDPVDLVHGHQHRPSGLGHGLDQWLELLLQQTGLGRVQGGVHQDDHAVAPGQGVPRGLQQEAVHLAAQLVDARRVEKDHLGLVRGQDAADAVARGLGPGRDDGHLLPEIADS